MLKIDYEILHIYMGNEELVNRCIAENPSRVKSLRNYRSAMSKFLMTQTHYHDFVELAELAQIEKAFANSFDAKNASFLVLEDLAQLNPEDWPALCFKFQPSLQLLAFRHNSFEIWQALAKDTPPPELRQIERPAHWVIWRARSLIS